MAPSKLNLKIFQGSTFTEVLRWESSTKVYAPISGITRTAPVVVLSNYHGIPLNWRVKVSGVLGMKEINSGDNSKLFTPTPIKSNVIDNQLKKVNIKHKFNKNNYEEELARKIMKANRN